MTAAFRTECKIYRRHNCSSNHWLYRRMARCIWRRAVWISGEGPYACVANCGRGTSVTLHETCESAQASKRQIDWLGCGGFCHWSGHKVVELELPGA